MSELEGQMELADVVEMEPANTRSCFKCKNVVYPHGGTFCWTYQEEIVSERLAASDCPMYERDPDAPA